MIYCVFIIIMESYSLPVVVEYIKKYPIAKATLILPRNHLIPNECQVYKQILEEKVNADIKEHHTFYTCSYWIIGN